MTPPSASKRPRLLPATGGLLLLTAALLGGAYVLKSDRGGVGTTNTVAATAPLRRAAPTSLDALLEAARGQEGGVKDFLERAKAAGHGDAEVVDFLKANAPESPAFAFDALARLLPAEGFRGFLDSFFQEQGGLDFPRALEMLAVLDGGNFTLAAGAVLPRTRSGSGENELLESLSRLYARFPGGSRRHSLEDAGFATVVISCLTMLPYSPGERAQLLENPAFEGSLKDALAWNEWLCGGGAEGRSIRAASELLAKAGTLSDETVERILGGVMDPRTSQHPADFAALADRLAAGHGKESALLAAIRISPPGDAGLPDLLAALPPARAQEGLAVVTRSLAGIPLKDALAGLQALAGEQQDGIAKGLASQLAGSNRQDDARQLLAAFPGAGWRQEVEKMLESQPVR
ncbi:MAG: hypothetical protein JWO82_2518 [Akkermansiaceae bacterium]|nr:hypothetical protein [Akkermansiaceae bacterium]